MADGFDYEEKSLPRVFLQWKGTDACLDFHCECGTEGHFDGYFAYALRCPFCGAVWQMPWNLFPRKAPSDYDGIVKDFELYEDFEVTSASASQSPG